MKKFWYTLSFAVIIVIASFMAGSWYNRQKALPSPKSTALNSGVKPDTVTNTDTNKDASSTSSGGIRISPEKQQEIGVQVATVEKLPVVHALRALGRVVPDERRIYRINASVDGWIRETLDNSTGSLVKKGELLATFYSPEFLGAQQAYLYALGSFDRFQATGKETPAQIDLTKANIQQYKDSLRNLGMSEHQIEEIGRTHLYTENIHIMAPTTGFVLFRNVSPGERFEKGKELYRIADLSRVWILADIFEGEAEYFGPGLKVKFFLPHQKKTFQAKVSDVLPQFDPSTRTLKVRLEADNPGYALRPDMFVDVELSINIPPAISVPADAILDSGIKRIVFVDLGKGLFEPREVDTGWHFGKRVEIVRGLKPGERIAISGNFLIDSESRLEMAAAGMYGPLSRDPVCGVEVSVNKAMRAGRKTLYKEKSYYFTSDECKAQFDKAPDRYVKK
jgi:membrane fusion protein, copper/silver efflux system